MAMKTITFDSDDDGTDMTNTIKDGADEYDDC
jgi:hypothetical protein